METVVGRPRAGGCQSSFAIGLRAGSDAAAQRLAAGRRVGRRRLGGGAEIRLAPRAAIRHVAGMLPPASASARPGSMARLTHWVLTSLTRVPGGARLRSLLGVAAGLLAIGWFDYVTGTRMSFVVFYLVPVTLATAWFGRSAGILTALTSVVIRFIADSRDDATTLQETWLWWNSFGSLIVYLAVVWLFDALVQLHRQLEQRVRERTLELEEEVRKRQAVQRELLELSGRERSAMGRELHDQLGQHLVGTAMAAQVLAERLQSRGENGAREARQIADLVEQGIAQTRQLAQGLLLAHIEPARLASELEELCATLRQQFPRVECVCQVDPTAQLRDGHAAAQTYRLVQEALRNALRHSGARRVVLRVTAHDHGLEIAVEDDGRGLPEQRYGPGMGLRIMQHRAEHIGTRLELSARPGGGTRVACLVPFEPPARPLT